MSDAIIPPDPDDLAAAEHDTELSQAEKAVIERQLRLEVERFEGGIEG